MKANKIIFNNKAFTMMELLIVVVLVGVLAQLAFFGYRKTVEGGRLDQAKVILEQVSNAAIRFNIDYPARAFNSSTKLTGGTTSSICSITRAGSALLSPNVLIDCNYLQDKNWTQLPFNFYVCEKGNETGNCVPPLSTTGRVVAYMQAKENSSEYSTETIYMWNEGLGVREKTIS